MLHVSYTCYTAPCQFCYTAPLQFIFASSPFESRCQTAEARWLFWAAHYQGQRNIHFKTFAMDL
jgi:hypothetical protein